LPLDLAHASGNGPESRTGLVLAFDFKLSPDFPVCHPHSFLFEISVKFRRRGVINQRVDFLRSFRLSFQKVSQVIEPVGKIICHADGYVSQRDTPSLDTMTCKDGSQFISATGKAVKDGQQFDPNF
jgi:hypothetical protein